MVEASSLAGQRLKLLKVKHTCHDCDLRRIIGRAREEGGFDLRESSLPIRCRGPFRRGDRIFSVGEPIDRVFALTSGSVAMVDPESAGRIVDFVLQGELFGVDALASRQHRYNAVALDRCWVCELPLDELEVHCEREPAILSQLMLQFGEHLNACRDRQQRFAGMAPIERLRELAGDLFQRLDSRLPPEEQRGWAGIGQEELADYLGIGVGELPALIEQCRSGVSGSGCHSLFDWVLGD